MQDKILLVTEGFPFENCERGFLETEFGELVKHFRMHVLSNNTTGEIVHDFPPDVPCWRYGFERLDILRLPMQLRYPEVREDILWCWKDAQVKNRIKGVLRILAYSLRAEKLFKQIERIVKEKSIDLVYTYWCTQATVSAVRLKKRYPKLQIVARFHGYDLYRERTSENWQPLRPFIARNADLLVFVCSKGKEYFLSKWPGEWEKRCIISHLGTKSMRRVVSNNADKLVVVSCSNLIPLKRVDMIIEALALLPESQKVEWHHLGDGSERESLERLTTEKLTCKPHVSWKFWGNVPHDEIENVYQHIAPDLFITTSSTEGLPVSVQEAMSMGIAVIGTDVGGMAELVKDGKNGFLLPRNTTPKKICEMLQEYMQLSPNQRRAYSRQSYCLWKEHYNAAINAHEFVGKLQSTILK